MRLFIAVSADDPVRSAAAAVSQRLRRSGGDYRWVDPRDMHTTLRFLGETREEELPEVEALMRRAATTRSPFEAVYGGVGAFDSLDDPRVVWIGLEGGVEGLGDLARALGRDEPRPFFPHLTLGRRRREPVPASFLEALRGEAPLHLRQPVSRISLYASRPAPFGHAYEVLIDVPLGVG